MPLVMSERTARELCASTKKQVLSEPELTFCYWQTICYYYFYDPGNLTQKRVLIIFFRRLAMTSSVTTLAMCCPVIPGKAEAKYENGLLRITAPFSDAMGGAVG